MYVHRGRRTPLSDRAPAPRLTEPLTDGMLRLVCPLVCSQPDPAGARLAVLRPALKQLGYIVGLFFDFSSLYQPPRTADQDVIFKKALPPCVPRLFEPTDPSAPPRNAHAPFRLFAPPPAFLPCGRAG